MVENVRHFFTMIYNPYNILLLELSDDWFYKSISMYKHLLMYNLPVQPEAVVLEAGGDLLALTGTVQYTYIRIKYSVLFVLFDAISFALMTDWTNVHLH